MRSGISCTERSLRRRRGTDSRVVSVLLHRFAAAVCPPDVEPDDLLQEALYRVLRRGGLSDIPYPTAYLRRTITNLLAKHWRSAGRRRRAWSRSGVTEPAHPEYPSDLADLLRLQPRARAVLYMRAIEGRPFTEVAEVLGCAEVAAAAWRQGREEAPLGPGRGGARCDGLTRR